MSRIRPITATGKQRERGLIRLVFVSTAAPGLTACDLDEIAAVSRARNEAAGLTGLLLHQVDSFYCVLEGPQARVFQRMEAIICDKRHARVEILAEERITSRRFENWSFGSLPRSARAAVHDHREDFIRSLASRLE